MTTPTPGFQKTAETLEAESANIKEDVRSIKESGQNIARDLKRDSVEVAKAASNDAHHKLADVKVEMQHKLEDLKATASERLEVIEQEVKTHPLQSMAIAFAAGALVSLVLGRR